MTDDAPAEPPKLYTFRGYADWRKQRGLNGKWLRAVQTAVESGRISAAVVTLENGKKKINGALADKLWAENTDAERSDRSMKQMGTERPAGGTIPLKPRAMPRGRAEGAGEFDVSEDLTTGVDLDENGDPLIHSRMTMAHASTAEKIWKARSAELDYRKKAGELVEVAEVETAWSGIIAASRSKVLGIPSKLKTRIPHLTVEEISAVAEVVRDTLEELADSASVAPAS